MIKKGYGKFRFIYRILGSRIGLPHLKFNSSLPGFYRPLIQENNMGNADLFKVVAQETEILSC